MSDLPSQYTEDIKTFNQGIYIPDPSDILVPPASVMGLDLVAQKQERVALWGEAPLQVVKEVEQQAI